MSKTLVTAGPGNELQSGLFPGVDKLSAPFWQDGENVDFRKGGVVSSKGYTSLATLPGTVSELAQAFVDGEQRVYMAVGSGVYMRSSIGGLSSLGSFPTTGVPYFETYGSFLLGTNGVDPIMAWRNTGTFSAIAGLPFNRAKILHRRDNHVLALNTNLGQNHYAWCSDDDIDDWDPTEDNSAGDNFIRDLDSEIVAVCDLGAAVAVYSKETMALINFVGQPNVFAHQPAINGVGAVGARSVVQVGTRNAGITRQGIFMTDGSSFEYVDEPAMHDFIKENVDFSQAERIRSYHNEDLNSVFFYYTDFSGNRKGIGYNYKDGGFTRSTIAAEVALERQVFSYPIAAIGPKLVQIGDSENADGAPFSKWIRTKPLSAQDATIWKYWSHLKTVGKWADSQVKFGVMENEDGTGNVVEWFDTQDMAFENWIDRDAVFLVLEFRADTLDSYFSFSQLQIQGMPGGLVSG